MKLRTLSLVAAAAVATLATLNTSPATGGVKEGIAAHKAGDFETAFQEFLPVAEAGDPRAQNIIGSMYYRGQGVGRDAAEAAMWFQRAADQGHVEAQYKLGLLYRLGQGVPQDEQKARDWFEAAAKQGHQQAKAALAVPPVQAEQITEKARLERLYNEGITALKAKDFELAFNKLHEVARHGVAQAQYILGVMLCNGVGVPARDLDACSDWLQKAVAQGHAEAKKRLIAEQGREIAEADRKIDESEQELARIDAVICGTNRAIVDEWFFLFQSIRPQPFETHPAVGSARYNDIVEDLHVRCGVSPSLADALSAYFIRQEFERARALFAESCVQDEALGCHFAGMVLLSGDGGPADPTGGRAELQKVCEGGLEVSCEALDRLSAR